MQQNINEIEINGVKYVPKGTETPALNTKNAVIVRCEKAGVFFGYLTKEIDLKESSLILINARRIWYWSGAASLSQLAVDGTKKPGECKFPTAVPSITLFGVLEIIPCTETAVNSINGVAIWKQ